MTGRKRQAALLVLAIGAAVLTAGISYAFIQQGAEIGTESSEAEFLITGPDSVAFELFSVVTPGQVTIRAEWEGTAGELELRLEGPPSPQTDYRNTYLKTQGTSPLEAYYSVTQNDIDRGVAWRIVLRDPTNERVAHGVFEWSIPVTEASSAAFHEAKISLRSGEYWPRPGYDSILSHLEGAPDDGIHALISMHRTPFCQQEALLLERSGVIRQSFLPDGHAYGLIRQNADLSAEIVVELVKSLNPIPLELKVEPHILVGDYAHFEIETGDGLTNYALNDDGTLALSVLFAQDVDLERIQQVLMVEAIRSTPASDQLWLVTLEPSRLASLARYDLVEWIEPGPMPLLTTNDLTRQELHVDSVQAAQVNASGALILVGGDPVYNGLTGEGVVVGVCDNGVDDTHDDLDVVHDAGGASPHGTHVAGIVAGSGELSSVWDPTKNPFHWRGMAPEASIIDANLHAAKDQWEAIEDHGLDVANHSHVQSLNGDYSTGVRLLDQGIRGGMVWNGNRVPRILHFVTAGNEGTSTQYGEQVDYFSLTSQGKNVFVTGNWDSHNNHLDPGSSMGPTHDGRVKPDAVAPGHGIWSCDFRQNEIQIIRIVGGVPTTGTFTLTLGGNTTATLPFDATAAAVQTALVNLPNLNPADVVTGGGPLPADQVWVRFQGALQFTNVAQMTSADSAFDNGASTTVGTRQGGYDNRDGYRAMGGTSMSSPAVAGVSALLLQAWQDTYSTPLGTTIDDNPPLPSTLRAILIGTAEDLANANIRGANTTCVDVDAGSNSLGNATATAGPDYATGWGLVNAEEAAELVQDHRIEDGVPVPNRIIQHEISNGITLEYDFVVDDATQLSGVALRVTLAWDDIEASTASPATSPRLINDLDLELVDPTGTIHYPWQLGHTIQDASGNPLADNAQPPGTSIQIDIPIEPTETPSTSNDPVPQAALQAGGDWVARRGKDHLNNVEQVLVDNLQPDQVGHWQIRVIGFDVRQGPQDYSVVGFPYPDLPDLVASCSQYAKIPGLEQEFSFTWQYENIGPVPTTNTYETLSYRILLSKDFYADSNDVEITDINSSSATLTLPVSGTAPVSRTSKVKITQADIDALTGNTTTTLEDLLESDVFVLVEVDSDDDILEHHETNVALVQLARAVDVVLVIDRSGSMGGDVTVSNNTKRTKLSILQDSVEMFLDTLRRNAADQLGIVSFSGDIGSQSITTDLSLTAYDDSARSAAETALASLTAKGMTDIKGGLQEGISELLTGDASHRRVLVFFSDGQRTTGDDPTEQTFLDQFWSNNIHMFCVGFGTAGASGASGIDVPLLETLSQAGIGTRGFFQVTEITSSLQKFYVDALAGAIQAGLRVDPEADIGPYETDVIEARVSSRDTSITFILGWDDPGAYLSLAVRTPTGHYVPLGNASKYGGQVTTESSDTHTVMRFDLPFNAGTSSDHAGVWEMVIANDGANEARYAAAVMGDRMPDITVSVSSPGPAPGFATSEAIGFSVNLQALEREAADRAIVTIIPTVPTTSLGEILTASPVSSQELAAIPQEVNGEPLLHRERLMMALQARDPGTSPIGSMTKEPFELRLIGKGEGEYTGAFPDTATPGIYSFLVRVETVLDNCEPYALEFLETVYVAPKPSPLHSTLKAKHIRSGPPWEVEIEIVPITADQLLVGPGERVQIFRSSGAEVTPLTSVVDHQDGTYTRTFSGLEEKAVEFQVEVNGVRLGFVTYDPCEYSNLLLTIGLSDLIATLDPRVAWSKAERAVIGSLFEPLILFDPTTLQPVPWIATSWEWIGEDQFRLFLREGVKFHNDEDLTSEDVAYTLRWITDPSNGSPTAIQLFWLGDVEIIDDYTVDLRTRPEFTPYAALVASLNVPVVPMDTVLAVGDEEFATNPVGSGPYLFSEWLYGDHVELKRNESYWGEHPYLETVLYREIREPTVMALELEAGSVDIAYSVPPSSVAFLSELPHLDVRSVPSLSCTQLHFNLESSIAQDIRFRQAVYRSVDWDAAVFSIFQDAQASRIYGCVPPILEADSSLALEDDVLYEDDGLAQQLFGELRAEGVLDEWRALRILTPMSEPMRTLSAILAASLEENGVPAEVVCVDEPAFLEYLRNRDPEEFEMILYEWSAGPDPHGFIYPLFHSDNAFEGSAANVSRTRDSELDWLIDHAGTSLDPTARESYYVEVQRLIHQRVYAIPILSAAATYITSERVHAFVGDALMDLWLATPLWRVFVEGDCN